MRSGLSAVLFDCDGVIADSEQSWNDIDHEHLAHFGVPDYHGQFKPQVLGKSLPLSEGFYRDTFGIEATLDEMLEHRIGVAQKFYAHKIPLFEGAREVLEWVRAHGFKIALATSSVGALIHPFLARHDLTDLFDSVITGEQVRQGKPHPDIYLLAAASVETAPAHCLVVEDALSGLQAGRGAGCATVAIPDARWLDPKNFDGQSDYRIAALGELPSLIERIAGSPQGEEALAGEEAVAGAARLGGRT